MSLGVSFFIHFKCKAAGPCLKVKNTLPVTPEIISSPISYFLLNSWNISHFQMIFLTVILLDIQLITLNFYINWYITILHLHHSKITLFIARNVWTCFGLVCFMVLNVTFNIISVISWRSVLLVVETVVPGENHRPAASHSQTLSHNVVSSTPRLSWMIGTDCLSSCKFNYHTITTTTALTCFTSYHRLNYIHITTFPIITSCRILFSKTVWTTIVKF